MVARYYVRRSQAYGAALTLKGAASLAGSLDLHFPWPLTRTRALIGVGGLKCVQITVPSIRRNGMAKPVTRPKVTLATRLCPGKQPAPAMVAKVIDYTRLWRGETPRYPVVLSRESGCMDPFRVLSRPDLGGRKWLCGRGGLGGLRVPDAAKTSLFHPPAESPTPKPGLT